jgi:predicted Fe-Mo cluster-binding NifX family protein
MAKIGMMFSRPDLDAPLAEHFGKAKWLMVVEPPGSCELVRNTGLDGRSVADELARRGCTDVIVRHMGSGAYAHVTAAGIRVWRAGPDAAGRAQLLLLAAGTLSRFEPALAPDPQGPHSG